MRALLAVVLVAIARVAIALAPIVMVGCAASAPQGRTAGPRASGGESSNQQSRPAGASSEGALAPPATSPAVTAEWRECVIRDRSIWIAIPEGAALEAEGDGCFTLPGPGMTPETADWMLAVGHVERDHAHADLLAIEPDGARRFLVEEAEVRGAQPIGEGGLVLLEHPTRWYAVRGVADELGARDLAIARIPVADGWLVFVAGTRQQDQARLDALLRLLPMIRAR